MGLDVSAWRKIDRQLKTLNVTVDIRNKFGMVVTCPLFHIVHEFERHENYVENLSAAASLYSEKTGKALKPPITVTDGERALICASAEVFDPKNSLLCNFHQSKSLKKKFCERYKKEVENSESDIFHLFHALKWTILLPLNLSMQVLDEFCKMIRKIKFKSENMGVREIRMDLLEIMCY